MALYGVLMNGETMKIELDKKYRIKDSVKHQGIGGKTIILEKELAPDEVDKQAWNGNMSCLNFSMRRRDFLPSFDKRLYYGHVDNLGYVVCEDELIDLVNTSFLKKLKASLSVYWERINNE